MSTESVGKHLIQRNLCVLLNMLLWTLHLKTAQVDEHLSTVKYSSMFLAKSNSANVSNRITMMFIAGSSFFIAAINCAAWNSCENISWELWALSFTFRLCNYNSGVLYYNQASREGLMSAVWELTASKCQTWNRLFHMISFLGHTQKIFSAPHFSFSIKD